MEWKHWTSVEWLQARTAYLNASEVKDLIPFTPTGRKRNITDDDYFRIAHTKRKVILPDDAKSTGAMARGHILEPYAINDFNEWREEFLVVVGFLPPYMYHWDDIVIYNPDLLTAFSPDGMDVAQPLLPGVFELDAVETFGTSIIEIKSYNVDRHIETMTKKGKDLPERWQIATAMTVDDNIKDAYLVHYNPSLRESMIIHHYDRSDLDEEINTVADVAIRWTRIIRSLNSVDPVGILCPPASDYPTVISMDPHEKEIIDNVNQKQNGMDLPKQRVFMSPEITD